jgi:hypothetical protein
MVDKITNNTVRIATDTQRRTTAATTIGMNAFKPIMHFQVSMLRMWTDNIERFAGNYQQGFEETATVVEEQSKKGARSARQQLGLGTALASNSNPGR